MKSEKRLLGELDFVSRTFEGRFKENPYVLDLDANLYIGPADQHSRDEHSAIEVIYHFLVETGRVRHGVKELLKSRVDLLDAYAALDEARADSESGEFRVYVFGTYDGDLLIPARDDNLPAGPCGKTVNELKQRFYELCARLDKDFQKRKLSPAQKRVERQFLQP